MTTENDGLPKTIPLDARGGEKTHLGSGALRAKVTPSNTRAIPKRFGEYNISREIGRGGMGIVYEATEADLNRRVAIKVLPVNSQIAGIHKKRFQNESRAVAQLNHPSIIPVYSVGEVDGVSYYAMRFIEGRDLHQVIQSIRSVLSTQHPPASDTPMAGRGSDTNRVVRDKDPTPRVKEASDTGSVELSASDFERTKTGRRYRSRQTAAKAVAKIGSQIADALQHAHDMGVTHRDIKPSNLMLDDAGHPWVTDFGLAQIRNTPSLTGTGVVLGTLRYMSPEQLAGIRGLVDHRTDIYSLGATLYELLTLQHLVTGKSSQDIIREVMHGPPVSVRKVDSSVPEDLATIIEKAMAKSPLDRYATASELAHDLRRFVSNKPILARRPSFAKRCRQWALRHKQATAGIAAGFLAVFLSLMVATSAVWSAYQRELNQHKKTEAALTESEARRLFARAALQLPHNPGLSGALAAVAMQSSTDIEGPSILLQASDKSHEYAVIRPREGVESGYVSISPNGEYCITCAASTYFGDGNYPATVHRMSDGQLVAKLDNENCITSGEYSPDGKYILTASGQDLKSDAPVLWNAQSGEKIREFFDHQLPETHDRIFSPDGTRLLVFKGSDLVVFDIKTESSALVIQAADAAIVFAEYSPSGSKLLTVAADSTYRVWTSSGEPLGKARRLTASVPHYANVRFADDDGIIVRDAGSLSRFEIESLSDDNVTPSATASSIESAISKDRANVASYIIDSVSLMSCRDLGMVCRVKRPPNLGKTKVHVNGDWLLVFDSEVVELYHSETGEAKGVLAGHDLMVNDVAVSTSTSRIATVSIDGTLRLWHTHNGLDRRTLGRDEHDGDLIAVSEDGERFVVTSDQKQYSTRVITLDGKDVGSPIQGSMFGWDNNIERLVTLNGTRAKVMAPLKAQRLYEGRFSNRLGGTCKMVGERHLAVTNLDGKGQLVNTETRSRRQIGGGSEYIVRVTRIPNTSKFVVASRNGRIFGYDAEGKGEMWSQDHPNRVTDLQISRDGKQIAALDANSVTLYPIDSPSEPSARFPLSVPASQLTLTSNLSHLIVHDRLDCKGVVAWALDSPDEIMKRDCAGKVRVHQHPAKPAVVVSGDHGAFIWALDTNADTLVTVENVSRSAISAEHVAVVVESAEGSSQKLEVYRLDTMEKVLSTNLRLPSTDLKFDSTGKYLLFTEIGYRAKFYELDKTDRSVELPLESAKIVWATCDKSGNATILSADGSLSASDKNGRVLSRKSLPGGKPTAWAVDERKSILLVGMSAGPPVLCNLAANTQTLIPEFNVNNATAIALNHEGTSGCVSSKDHPNEVTILDLRTRNPTPVLVADATRLALSNKHMLAIDKAGKAWAYEIPTNTLQEIDSDLEFRRVTINPNGSRAVFTAKEGEIEVRDLSDLKAPPKALSNVLGTAISNEFLFASHTDSISVRSFDRWDDVQYQLRASKSGNVLPIPSREANYVATPPRYLFESVLKPETQRNLTTEEAALYRIEFEEEQSEN